MLIPFLPESREGCLVSPQPTAREEVERRSNGESGERRAGGRGGGGEGGREGVDETVLDERLHSMWMKVFLTLVVFSPPLFCVLHPSGAQHIDCFTCVSQKLSTKFFPADQPRIHCKFHPPASAQFRPFPLRSHPFVPLTSCQRTPSPKLLAAATFCGEFERLSFGLSGKPS